MQKNDSENGMARLLSPDAYEEPVNVPDRKKNYVSKHGDHPQDVPVSKPEGGKFIPHKAANKNSGKS